MKLLRILLPAFVGIASYCCVGMLYGPRGVGAMRQLQAEQVRLTANLDALAGLNAELRSSLDNLSSDPDTISVYAHELGLVGEGERLIKLAGFSGGIDRKLFPGTAIEVRKPRYFPEWGCKLVGILSFFAMLLSITLLTGDKRRDHFKKLIVILNPCSTRLRSKRSPLSGYFCRRF